MTSAASRVEYSYMLPHGTRCAAIAREAIEITFAPSPAHATTRAIFHRTSRWNAR